MQNASASRQYAFLRSAQLDPRQRGDGLLAETGRRSLSVPPEAVGVPFSLPCIPSDLRTYQHIALDLHCTSRFGNVACNGAAYPHCGWVGFRRLRTPDRAAIFDQLLFADQEITRVLLNLISNGFYAAIKRKARRREATTSRCKLPRPRI